MLEEVIVVCVTVLGLAYMVTRVFVAQAKATEAINKRMAMIRSAKTKKNTSDEDESGSLVNALLDELGVPPAMALPVIQGAIQQWISGQKKPPEGGNLYT